MFPNLFLVNWTFIFSKRSFRVSIYKFRGMCSHRKNAICWSKFYKSAQNAIIGPFASKIAFCAYILAQNRVFIQLGEKSVKENPPFSKSGFWQFETGGAKIFSERANFQK